MRIFVSAKPRAKVEAVEKIDESHFVVSVKEPPVGGQANVAIIRALSDYLGTTPANLRIVSGYASKHKVIDILPEQKKIEGLGGNMRLGARKVEIKEGTKAHALYGSNAVVERFRHRYEVDPQYIEILEKHGLVFSGKAPEHPIMQILELPIHKFYVGSQFHPEFTSRPLAPNPLYVGFMKACLK